MDIFVQKFSDIFEKVESAVGHGCPTYEKQELALPQAGVPALQNEFIKDLYLIQRGNLKGVWSFINRGRALLFQHPQT